MCTEVIIKNPTTPHHITIDPGELATLYAVFAVELFC